MTDNNADIDDATELLRVLLTLTSSRVLVKLLGRVIESKITRLQHP